MEMGMSKHEIPLWVVATLGKQVVLTVKYEGPCTAYPAGWEGILTSIQVDDEGGFYVTVALDADDPSYLENFDFDQVRPATYKASFQIDAERGILIF